ncbi:MAG: ABC transporter permease [Deltaproteobacteria bacterium]|nr:ABC transporter permease [Deltaproteobacteria bacterium]
MRHLAAHALGSLGRRRGESLTAGLGLALAVALHAAVVFLAGSGLRAWLQGAALAPALTVTRTVAGNPAPVDTRDLAWLRDTPGVHSVTPRVWGSLTLDEGASVVLIAGLDTPLPAGLTGRGRSPRDGAREAVLGHALARRTGLRRGDTLPLAVPLRVVAVLPAESDRWASDAVLTDPPTARALLGLDAHQAMDLALEPGNAQELPVLRAKIHARGPDALLVERAALEEGYRRALGRRGGAALLGLLPSALVLLALLAGRLAGPTPALSREVATLRALGWSVGDVLWARLFEAAWVAALAVAAGLLGAHGYVFSLGAPGLRGWVLGQDHGGPLTPAAAPRDWLLLALYGLVPYLTAAVLGAWRDAVTDPAEVLRG